MSRHHRWQWGLVVAVAASTLAALTVGGVWVPPAELPGRLWHAVAGGGLGDPIDRILISVRLPRVLLALLAGGAMGIAGLASQTLFRNPLASPYVTGVANGAAVGAVTGLLLGGRWIGFAAVPFLSMACGLGTAALVYGLARRDGRFGQAILLAGIAISAFGSALTAGALYVAGERLQSLVFWLMGGLWPATWRDVWVLLPVTGAGYVALMRWAPAMNVLLAGERSARDLGVNVVRLHVGLLLTVAVLTAAVVSLTGVIGFIGLIVPHLLRLAFGGDHRCLLPACALGGAFLLVTADTLARTVAAPAEVPVGILTALLGAPVFLWMLRRRQNGGGG